MHELVRRMITEREQRRRWRKRGGEEERMKDEKGEAKKEVRGGEQRR